jgi:hypothetical protein
MAREIHFTFSLSPTYRLIGFNLKHFPYKLINNENITIKCEKSKYILDRNAKNIKKNAGADKKNSHPIGRLQYEDSFMY